MKQPDFSTAVIRSFGFALALSILACGILFVGFQP